MKLEALTDPRSTILRSHVMDLNDLADAFEEAEAEQRRKQEEAAKQKK